jgi:hypothetical protein
MQREQMQDVESVPGLFVCRTDRRYENKKLMMDLQVPAGGSGGGTEGAPLKTLEREIENRSSKPPDEASIQRMDVLDVRDAEIKGTTSL